MSKKLAEYASKLGMKVDELADVTRADEGVVITTRDGVQLVDVDEARPDAEGKSGLMRLIRPGEFTAENPYAGNFPVYVHALEAEPGSDEPTGDDTSTPDEQPDEDAAPEEILAWVAGDRDRAVAALDRESSRRKPRKSVIAELQNVLEQWNAGELARLAGELRELDDEQRRGLLEEKRDVLAANNITADEVLASLDEGEGGDQ